MKASLFIVSYNTRDQLRDCLQSVREAVRDISHEVFVVDNASEDGSAEMVAEEFPEVRLIANEINVGFAAANNQAFNQSTGETVFLVNPDSILDKQAVERVIDFMEEHPESGICGGTLMGMEGQRKPSVRRFPNAWYQFLTLSGLSDRFSQSRFFGAGDYKWFQQDRVMEVDWVPGAFTGLKRRMLTEIGFFDPRYFLYYEETDLCLRAKRHGWKIFFLPDAEVRHEGGASSKTCKDETYDGSAAQVMGFRMRSECLYFRKNYGVFSVIANIGVEFGVQALRHLASYRKGASGKARRQATAHQMKKLVEAMMDTKCGTYSPAKPW